MAKKRKWVAILGGSFDPPHLGHILLSQWVLAGYPIDELWWMPSHTHPWQKVLSPIKQRLAMCRLAVKHLPRGQVKVSDFEARYHSDGKSLHTLRALAKVYPRVRFNWVIGSDLYKARARWYRFATIARDFGFIVVPRGGRMGLPLISSRAIRSRLKRAGQKSIKNSEPTRHYLSPEVLHYIKLRGVYSRGKLR